MRAIADELDDLDAGFSALADFEDEIDAVIRNLDDLGFDMNVKPSAAPIDFDQARDIRLANRERNHSPSLRLDFGSKLLILDLLVALEGNAIDYRIFDDGNDEPSALNARSDVLKQTGGIQCFHALIDLERVQSTAWSRPEV